MPNQDGLDASLKNVVDAEDINPLGGADIEGLTEAAIQEIGNSAELDVPEFGIAIQSVSHGIGARIRHDGYKEDPACLAVFIITDRAREVAKNLDASGEPIVNNGSLQLNGYIWISGPGFKSGYKVKLLSSKKSEIFDQLSELELDKFQSFVFDPEASDLELKHYPSGSQDPDNVSTTLIAATEFNLETLDRLIQKCYESYLRTPDANLYKEGSPWSDSANYIPSRRAEASVQNWLLICLKAGFENPFDCYFEMPGTDGRCDLMLICKNLDQENSITYLAAFELKILRSKTSKGKKASKKSNVDAVEKGAKQALAYKTEHGSAHGLLLSFDMRVPSEKSDCFNDNIKQYANDNCIELRSYALYGSSDDHRSAAFPIS